MVYFYPTEEAKLKLIPMQGLEDDPVLLQGAIAGDRKYLELLLKKHQDFIYNIALRLYLNPDDALDATQEVLIKVFTKLNTFQGNSQFKTWLYRIVVNHFLNAPKGKYEMTHVVEPSFEEAEEEFSEAEVEEVRILCATAMLMCLSREQRLIYIIGEIFGADHNLGAELFSISPSNYRVKLHRAREDLKTYVSGKCGLVDSRNPCRCPKKTRVMVKMGLVDKQNLRFNTSFTTKVQDWVKEQRFDARNEVEKKMKELFQDSPFQIRKDLERLIDSIPT
ncbi:RNA polymerase, sigma-24 subunit, ECF subfamily [Leptospira ryugenii]|uniref:RNA polymerase, sigma-24 subunit, ECF subfamily n=1 Tax=Leptospira ryugenii TaxID=1917863 RepID=A0A2P2E253_9LEPT|nr:sigma-70 family RNA polymerase sigma factor [Leptospira ryugenii]GBF50975.1 RNA polymerase, sigma-24 subunit, ECF subfamily [Leptospira ryugenii]